EESDCRDLAVHPRLLRSGDGGGGVSLQEVRIGEGDELSRCSIGALGRQIRRRALLKHLHSVRETTVMRRQIAKARRGPRCAASTHRCKRTICLRGLLYLTLSNL